MANTASQIFPLPVLKHSESSHPHLAAAKAGNPKINEVCDFRFVDSQMVDFVAVHVNDVETFLSCLSMLCPLTARLIFTVDDVQRNPVVTCLAMFEIDEYAVGHLIQRKS